MESDGDTDKCIYTAEVKTSLYICKLPKLAY